MHGKKKLEYLSAKTFLCRRRLLGLFNELPVRVTAVEVSSLEALKFDFKFNIGLASRADLGFIRFDSLEEV